MHILPLKLSATIIERSTCCAREPPRSPTPTCGPGGPAHVAAIGILARRNRYQAELLAAQLQRAPLGQASIAQAQGVPAALRCRRDALELLRADAAHHNRRLSEVVRQAAGGSSTADELSRVRSLQARNAEGWKGPTETRVAHPHPAPERDGL